MPAVVGKSAACSYGIECLPLRDVEPQALTSRVPPWPAFATTHDSIMHSTGDLAGAMQGMQLGAAGYSSGAPHYGTPRDQYGENLRHSNGGMTGPATQGMGYGMGGASSNMWDPRMDRMGFDAGAGGAGSPPRQWPGGGPGAVQPYYSQGMGMSPVYEGGAGYPGAYPGLAPAGQAYFLWTHDARQQILDKYFAKDHARKVRVLEEQKKALDSQVSLKKASLEAAQEIRKLEVGMANLARQVEKNSYELTGQPPVQVCTLDQLSARVAAAVDEAIKITKKKTLVDETNTIGSSLYRPPPDMRSLLEQLTSPDWFARMSLPANMETLQLALAMRRDMMDLERLREVEQHQATWDMRAQDRVHAQEAHAQAVQRTLLSAQLERQAAELQARLVSDAQRAVDDAAAVLSSNVDAVAHTGSAARNESSPAGAHSRSESPVRSMRLSPVTWQYEPSADYTGTSIALVSSYSHVPGTAPVAMVPRTTSD